MLALGGHVVCVSIGGSCGVCLHWGVMWCVLALGGHVVCVSIGGSRGVC